MLQIGKILPKTMKLVQNINYNGLLLHENRYNIIVANKLLDLLRPEKKYR